VDRYENLQDPRDRLIPPPPADGHRGGVALESAGPGAAIRGSSASVWLLSRARNAPSSWIVLISGAGKITVEFFDRDLDQRLQVAKLQGQRVGHHDVERVGELTGGKRLALGGDDLGALLALGSACFAIARFMLSGSWMSFSSTSVTSTPQSSVWTSRISRMCPLIFSVSASVSSSVCCPTAERSVVWAIWSIAVATS